VVDGVVLRGEIGLQFGGRICIELGGRIMRAGLTV